MASFASFTVNNLENIDEELKKWQNYKVLNIQRHTESRSYEVFIEKQYVETQKD